jgi:hypothetical protein
MPIGTDEVTTHVATSPPSGGLPYDPPSNADGAVWPPHAMRPDAVAASCTTTARLTMLDTRVLAMPSAS